MSAFKRPHETRESWLNEAVHHLAPEFERVGAPLPQRIRIAIGFCSTGRRGRRVGECWTDTASADQHYEIFIRPEIADPIETLDILAHELVHTAVGVKAKHGKIFRRVALAIGLTGRMRSTVAGPELLAKLQTINAALGVFPHAELRGSNGDKKQRARLLKCSCPQCGYTARIAASWLEKGAPFCPSDGVQLVSATDVPVTA